MIHSTRSMPSGNLAEPQRPFRFPADYYTAPLSEVTPIFPRWVPMGCGSASAVFLVLLFVAGAVFTGSYFGEFMDFIIGTSLGEVRSMYGPDVTMEQKERFETELETMRTALRGGNVPVQKLQPFMKSMQAAISDKRVTGQELDELTKAAHEATEAKKAPKR
jgi:hypothetical protein